MAVARRPLLWGAALTSAARHVPPGWWRSHGAWRHVGPWLLFRMETAYGAETATPTAADVVTWLRWTRAWARVRR